MKRIKKILSIALCAVITASLFSGCSSKNESIDFIYPFSGNVNSFDPQVAATADEFLIAENCFEGLVRIRDDGTVRDGVAESWEISNDGLTYTFKLKKGIKWRISEKSAVTELMGESFNPDITADDFVFALQRAADPSTECPLFTSIASIENAGEIHSGKMAADKLGVTANDDYTLVIKLKSADEGFLNAMSTAVAMPCNREYFNATKGRYGLGLSYSMFNGQFYVSSILESSYILRNNKLYTGSHPSSVSDVTLNIINEESDVAQKLKSGYYDCAYITGKEYESIDDSKITVTPYSNKLWAMVLNKNRQIFSNTDLRKAVCLSISNPETQQHSYLTKAGGLTPPSCSIEGKPANEAIGNSSYSQDTEKAVELWRKGLEEEKYTSANLTVIATEDMEATAKQLVQGIQGSIGKISSYGKEGKISFSLKIDVLSQKDFDTAFSNGEYDLALHCFESDSQSAVTFLGDIIKGNYLGEIDGIDSLMNEAQNAAANDSAAKCKTVEEKIISDYSLLPIYYEASYYAQANGVSGVDFHPGSGRVSFINATRED